MKLNQLIHENLWESMKNSLLNLYPGYSQNISAFQDVYKNLLELKPNESDFVISIDFEIAEDIAENWHHVHAYKKHDINKQFYGLSIDKWENWLGMDIDEITYTNYSQTDIIAHCIWEMTFWGFDQQTIKNALDIDNEDNELE